MTTPVNLAKLEAVFDAQVLQGIKYKLGGKAPSLSAKPAQLESGIDCSGEARLLLHQSTDGAVTIPDGSWNQRAWCEKNLEEVPYSTALHAHEGELFIAFITAGQKGAGRVGHVWLVVGEKQGKTNTTMESYGGHGIGSRNADYPTLVRQVHKCFRVPTVRDEKPAVAPAPISPKSRQIAFDVNDKTSPSVEAELVNGRYVAPITEVLDVLGFETQTNPLKTNPTHLVLNVWKKGSTPRGGK